MIKYIILIKKRPDLSKEEFAKYWLTQHAPIIKKLPGIKRYSINVSIGDEQPYDGMAELCFDDLETFNMSQTSPARQQARADGENFEDVKSVLRLVTEEHIIL